MVDAGALSTSHCRLHDEHQLDASAACRIAAVGDGRALQILGVPLDSLAWTRGGDVYVVVVGRAGDGGGRHNGRGRGEERRHDMLHVYEGFHRVGSFRR